MLPNPVLNIVEEEKRRRRNSVDRFALCCKASNPDFDSSTVIAAADPHITRKYTILNAKTYEKVTFIKIEKMN